MRNVLASLILVVALIAAVTAALLPVVLITFGSGGIGAVSLDVQIFPALLVALLLVNWMLRARAQRHSQFASAVVRFHLWVTVGALVIESAWLLFGWPTAFPAQSGDQMTTMRWVMVLFYLTVVVIATQFVAIACALACAIAHPWPSRPRVTA